MQIIFYFNNAIKTSDHPIALWRIFKSLVPNTSTHKPLPSSMIFNEKLINNKPVIVYTSNKHFVDIYSYSDVNSVTYCQLLALRYV